MACYLLSAGLTTRSVQDRNFFDLRKQGSVGWQSTPSHFMVQLPGQDSSIMFSYRDVGNHWMLKPAAGRSCSTWVWVEAELSNVASGERVLCLQANDHGSFKASIIGATELGVAVAEAQQRKAVQEAQDGQSVEEDVDGLDTPPPPGIPAAMHQGCYDSTQQQQDLRRSTRKRKHTAMYSDDLGAHSSDDSGVDDSDVGGAQGWCSDIDSIEQGHGDVGDGAVMHEEEQQEQQEQPDAERAGASAPRGGNAQRTHHKRLRKTGPATALIQDMPRDFTLQNLELLMSEQGLNNLTTPPLTGERALEIGWRVGKFPTGPGTLYRWPGGQRWYKARPKTGRRLACLDDAAYDVAMGCVGALRRDESLYKKGTMRRGKTVRQNRKAPQDATSPASMNPTTPAGDQDPAPASAIQEGSGRDTAARRPAPTPVLRGRAAATVAGSLPKPTPSSSSPEPTAPGSSPAAPPGTQHAAGRVLQSGTQHMACKNAPSAANPKLSNAHVGMGTAATKTGSGAAIPSSTGVTSPSAAAVTNEHAHAADINQPMHTAAAASGAAAADVDDAQHDAGGAADNAGSGAAGNAGGGTALCGAALARDLRAKADSTSHQTTALVSKLRSGVQQCEQALGRQQQLLQAMERQQQLLPVFQPLGQALETAMRFYDNAQQGGVEFMVLAAERIVQEALAKLQEAHTDHASTIQQLGDVAAVAQLEQACMQLDVQLKATQTAEAQVQQLQQALGALNAQLSDCKQRELGLIVSHKQQVAPLQRQLSTNGEQLQAAKVQLAEMAAQVETAKLEVRQAGKQHAQVQQQLDAQQIDMQKLRQHNAQLQQQLHEQAASAAQATAEQASAEQASAEQPSPQPSAELVARLADMTEQKQRLQHHNAKLQQQIAVLIAAKAQAETRASAATSQADASRQHLSAASDAAASAAARNAELEMAHGQAAQQVAMLQAQLALTKQQPQHQ